MFLLVSPRKSGTHLVLKWLTSKYPFLGRLKIGSHKQGLYSLGNTFHTSWNDFFYRLDREDFTGGKLLPIKSSLGVVSCRHPADMLLSHLEFSFSGENTVFSNVQLGDVLEKAIFTIDDAFYEDFFFSCFQYTGWSRLENFLTVSFEEMVQFPVVGKSSYSSIDDASRLLNVEFSREYLGNSPTFSRGLAGRGVEWIKRYRPDYAKNKWYLKYCEYYGYDPLVGGIPKNLKRINNKRFQLHDGRPVDVPQLVEESFLNHRILYFNGKIYAIESDKDFFECLEASSVTIVCDSVEEARALVAVHSMRS